MISTRFEWWRRVILTRHQTAAYHYFKAVMLTCNKVWGFLKHFTDLSRKWLQGRRFTSAEVCHVGIKNIFGQFVSRQCGDKGEARRMFKKVTLIFNNFFLLWRPCACQSHSIYLYKKWKTLRLNVNFGPWTSMMRRRSGKASKRIKVNPPLKFYVCR